MRIKDMLMAKKVIDSWGSWGVGSIPQKNFPLSKAKQKAYKFGSSTAWRVVTFGCLGRDFRLLVIVAEDKQECRVWLGEVRGNDTALILRFEFHGTHPGWHIHSHCEDTKEAKVGVVQYQSSRRIPKANGYHRKQEFGVSKDTLMDFVSRSLNLSPKDFRLQ